VTPRPILEQLVQFNQRQVAIRSAESAKSEATSLPNLSPQNLLEKLRSVHGATRDAIINSSNLQSPAAKVKVDEDIAFAIAQIGTAAKIKPDEAIAVLGDLGQFAREHGKPAASDVAVFSLRMIAADRSQTQAAQAEALAVMKKLGYSK
jgi:hypothetical protein